MQYKTTSSVEGILSLTTTRYCVLPTLEHRSSVAHKVLLATSAHSLRQHFGSGTICCLTYNTTWLVVWSLVSLGGHLRHFFLGVGPQRSAACVDCILETLLLTYLLTYLLNSAPLYWRWVKMTLVKFLHRSRCQTSSNCVDRLRCRDCGCDKT